VKVSMVEVCRDEDVGSIGAWYVRDHAAQAGHVVDLLRDTKAGYDVELISVHHCTDFLRLATIPKCARWRIVGGHPMQNNPLPVIPFADAVCVGEAENWIEQALGRLEHSRDIESLADLPGTIVSKLWRRGDPVPKANVERPLPENRPYLNYAGTRSAAWYVEIARGCPYRCDYCELGNSTPYRFYSVEQVKQMLDQVDTSKARKINFFAPDEASHPYYQELYEYLLTKGFAASFSSMRIDSVLKYGLPDGMDTNHLIRVGIDGMTEATRERVHKHITDDMIVEYFRMLLARGFVQFKTFMMFGYPWEQRSDFDGYMTLMDRIFSLPLSKSVSLRVKWTPLIPQPCTPLAEAMPKYDYDMVERINAWHEIHRHPSREPGFWVTNDGIMSSRSHALQCKLTSGNEDALLQCRDARPLYQL
jgi:radical SAM superfamily enzyme YgiQ (UPF0313 family)